MPSLDQQTIPASGSQRIDLPTKKGLAVLKLTNESPRAMRYRDKDSNYGDVIPANGSVAYHTFLKDKIPRTFWVLGTAADTFAVYFTEEE